MKYKFYSIRINVTKYNVTFANPFPSWLRHWFQVYKISFQGKRGKKRKLQ